MAASKVLIIPPSFSVERRPQSDFERPGGEPPGEPEVWVIVEQRDASNRVTQVAQTAYTAFELSGIKSREGLLLSYSEVVVTHSEPATKARQIDGMEAGMRHIFSPPKPPRETRPTKFRRTKSKLNGHSKTKGESDG
jgi:hypothetical protein